MVVISDVIMQKCFLFCSNLKLVAPNRKRTKKWSDVFQSRGFSFNTFHLSILFTSGAKERTRLINEGASTNSRTRVGLQTGGKGSSPWDTATYCTWLTSFTWNLTKRIIHYLISSQFLKTVIKLRSVLTKIFCLRWRSRSFTTVIFNWSYVVDCK